MRERGRKASGVPTGGRIRQMMQSSLEASLKALRSDYIDIVLVHGVSSAEILNHDAVKGFFVEAKKKGQIRAAGFSSHRNHVEMVKEANKTNFYDVIMVPYNHRGSYNHMLSGSYNEWDQAALERELEKARKNGVAIVAMKTCSGGPFSPEENEKATYQKALEWVLKHDYIKTMAVAMGNVDEINENIRAMNPKRS